MSSGIVWRSWTAREREIFNSTEARPWESRIINAIGEVKQAILEDSARAEPVREPKTSAA